eukprot:883074_1
MSDPRELLTFGYIRNICYMPPEIILLIVEFIQAFIDSTILNDEEKNYLFQLITEQNQTAQFKNCEWELLARGTTNGMKQSIFHEYCDGKQNTICLLDIHSTGFICGGYASSAWQSTDSNYQVKDDNAYLFVIRPKSKRKIFHRKKNNDGVLIEPNG